MITTVVPHSPILEQDESKLPDAQKGKTSENSKVDSSETASNIEETASTADKSQVKKDPLDFHLREFFQNDGNFSLGNMPELLSVSILPAFNIVNFRVFLLFLLIFVI